VITGRELLRVRESADSYADRLKRLYTTDPFIHPQKIKRFFLLSRILDNLYNPGSILLDVGFRYAEGGVMLNWLLRGGKVYGVEFSEKSFNNTLEFFKRAIISEKISEINLIERLILIYGNFLELKLARRSFDVALLVDVLASYQETSHKEALIRKLEGHIKKRGHILITTLSCRDRKTAKWYAKQEPPLYSTTLNEMKFILENCEFSEFNVKRLEETNTLLAWAIK